MWRVSVSVVLGGTLFIICALRLVLRMRVTTCRGRVLWLISDRSLGLHDMEPNRKVANMTAWSERERAYMELVP